jgi:hypothetical protein
VVNDVAHVGLVDSHSECNGSANELDVSLAPLVVAASALRRFQPRMVKRDLLCFSRVLETQRLNQFFGGLLAILL